MNRIRILIVEDEPIIAENIAMYLNDNDFIVSDIAYDAEAARQQIISNTPDAVLIDINLGAGEDGIELAAFIHRNYSIPLLFLTLDRAKEVEPGAYIVKPFDKKTLLAALEIALSNFAMRKKRQVPVLSFFKINKHLVNQLSQREFEVLQLIYEGKTNLEIASKIPLSVNTVKKHINSAYLKLDVATRTTAIARLLELTAM
jgi:DNA-binding NarL/FixJ family response regulator